METFINYITESSIILIILYILYILLFARDRHFTTARAYLLLAPVVAVTLPLLHIPLFNSTELQTIKHAVQMPEVVLPEVAAQSRENSGMQPWQIAAIIYAIGAGFFLFRLLYQIMLLIRIVGISRKAPAQNGSYTLVKTGGKFPTCSFFNYLLWDDTLPLGDEEKNQIMRHEEAHIRQRHSYDVIYYEVLRALFWFNPAIHGLKKALSDVHEFLADEQAVEEIGKKSYLSLLAKQILLSFNLSISNNFHQSQTKKRMKMISNINRKKPLWIKLSALAPVMAIIFFVFSCDDNQSNSAQDTIPEMPSYQEGDAIDMDTGPEDIFMVVEKMPLPEIGMEAYYDYLSSQINYPERAKANKIEGRVFVQFVVDENGNPTDITVKKGLGFGCDEEAVRMIQNGPKWQPGTQRGRKVKVRMILPISFSLSSKADDTSGGTTMVVKDNVVHTLVDERPVPIGGMASFYEYIANNLTYPEEARKNKVQGKVFVQFVVDENGNITNAESVKGIGFGCDEEAARVVENAPKWVPGKDKGKNVKVRMIIPVTFLLD